LLQLIRTELDVCRWARIATRCSNAHWLQYHPVREELPEGDLSHRLWAMSPDQPRLVIRSKRQAGKIGNFLLHDRILVMEIESARRSVLRYLRELDFAPREPLVDLANVPKFEYHVYRTRADPGALRLDASYGDGPALLTLRAGYYFVDEGELLLASRVIASEALLLLARHGFDAAQVVDRPPTRLLASAWEPDFALESSLGFESTLALFAGAEADSQLHAKAEQRLAEMTERRIRAAPPIRAQLADALPPAVADWFSGWLQSGAWRDSAHFASSLTSGPPDQQCLTYHGEYERDEQDRSTVTLALPTSAATADSRSCGRRRPTTGTPSPGKSHSALPA